MNEANSNSTKSFVDINVEKIILDQKNYPQPLNYVMAATWLMAQYKAHSLKVLDVRNHCSFADFFLIASVENAIQGERIVDEISHQMKKYKRNFFSKEGSSESDWILLDAGDFIVHLFLEGSRDLFGLDGLWLTKAKVVTIPEDFYFSGIEKTTDQAKKSNSSGDTEGFF